MNPGENVPWPGKTPEEDSGGALISESAIPFSREGIVLLDAEGRIAYWDEEAEALLGYRSEEVIGKPFLNFSAPSNGLPFEASSSPSLPSCIALDGKAGRWAGFLYNLEGKRVDITISSYPLCLKGDDYRLVIMKEQAGETSLERALRESEERFMVVGRYLTDVIWIADLELRLLYASPSILYQTGFSAEEVVSRSLSELITPESFQRALMLKARELERASETDVFPPIPVEMVVEQCRRDGSTFPSEVRLGFLRHADGTPYGVLGVSRDISERVRLEEAQKEAAAAQAASRASQEYAAELKEIIGVAAHELRLPATLFKGYAHILRSHRSRMKEEELDRVLGELEAAADRLDRLVGNLMETSLIESRRLSLEKAELHPDELMRRAAEAVSFSGGDRVRMLASGGDLAVEADVDKVVRALSVLLDNAINYSPPDEEVIMRCVADDGWATFQVLDRGPGVPEEEREKIFWRFYRRKVRGASRGGMGLGLYVARSLAEMHGGRMWVEPREGGGSVFCMSLPLRRPTTTGQGTGSSD